jgi:hypothetical protein
MLIEKQSCYYLRIKHFHASKRGLKPPNIIELSKL